MAIELKELIIKATVGQQQGSTKKLSPADADIIKEELITACVEEVMERLERKTRTSYTSLSKLAR